MGYIIGAILIIITLLIIGLILRKRIYDEVDRQDDWKMNIMDRNIAAEISRIKTLNLSGETQEKFEEWKQQWEAIVTIKMGDIEEKLLKAEEAADHYRFSKAKKILRTAEGVLSSVEKEIDTILKELDLLMETEKTSREDAQKLLPNIKLLKKQLSQNRYQYGKAEAIYDKKLDELEKQLQNYAELTDNGNYMQAKEIVDETKNELEELHEVMQVFPQVYRACKQELPNQLAELSRGLEEMNQEGFHVAHLGFEKEIQHAQEKLSNFVADLEKGEVEEAKQYVIDLDERMKEMYHLLEKEAVAKGYIQSQLPGFQSALDETAATFAETKNEVEVLRKAYFFAEEDIAKYHELDNEINNLKKQYQTIAGKLQENNFSHVEIREQIEAGFNQLDAISKKHTAFEKQLENMRKDEMEAKEQLSKLRDQVHATYRRLRKSNIPGVPGFIYGLIEQATDKSDQVLKALEKQPLDIGRVQEALNEAKKANTQLIEQTDMILDQAYFTEQVIQYANRYRSKYPNLAAELAESERLFRAYEYELALEKAARAIEDVEPGALKKIEQRQQINA